MITRRSLLGGILGAACAPAVVRAASLMPIYVPKLVVPNWYEKAAREAFLDSRPTAQYIRHVGSGFGMATVKREGDAVAYDPPFYNELGMVVGWDNTQKLPPGWEFCHADGTLIEPQVTVDEQVVNQAWRNHDIEMLERKSQHFAPESSAGWKKPGNLGDQPGIIEAMARGRGFKLPWET